MSLISDSTQSAADDAAYAAHLRSRMGRAAVAPADVSPPSEGWLTLGSMRFHYLDWRGDGPPLVFLHGGGLNAHTWDVCCLALRDRFRCLALDLRGHGDSDWSEDGVYTIDRHAEDVGAFVNAVGLEDFALVGMSLGGVTALQVTIEQGARVEALALVDIIPRLPPPREVMDPTDFRIIAAFTDLDEAIRHAMAFNSRRSEEGLRFSLSRSLRALPDGRLTWKHDHRRVRPDRSSFGAAVERIWRESKAIQCPVLVARGAESQAIQRDQAQAFAAWLPHGRFVEIPDAGHTIQGDNPRGLLAELSPFLDKSYPSEGSDKARLNDGG